MFIDFDDKRYYLDKATGYYKSHMRKPEREYLHRAIYRSHFGNIPHGWQVHHKDENRGNNAIENLECLPLLDHNGRHRDANAVCGRRMIEQNGRIKRTFTCDNCGVEYVGTHNGINRWCSRTCANQHHNGKNRR